MAASPHSATVADAVYQIQLALFDGVATSDEHLFAAGAILSRPDYEDVVIERSVIGICGYPLCSNPLSLSAAPPHHQGRYRIALREHKVYDLEETRKYCSQACLVASRAFSGSLESEREGYVSLKKVENAFRAFGLGDFRKDDGLREDVSLGYGDLNIKEKGDAGNGEVSMEEWLGPSDAIEGYVPLRDRNQGHKFKIEVTPMEMVHDTGINEVGFASSIIMGEEFNISSLDVTRHPQHDISGAITKQLEDVVLQKKKSCTKRIHSRTSETKPVKKTSKSNQRKLKSKSTAATGDQAKVGPPKKSSVIIEDVSEQLGKELEDKLHLDKKMVSTEAPLKSSLKTSQTKGINRTVTWADETYDAPEKSNDYCGDNEEDGDGILRVASADACAAALTQAAEAVASGTLDVANAVSDAGIIILPQPQNKEDGGEPGEDDDMFELDRGYVKWPTKSVLLDQDTFDFEDSWHDTPPEGFSLTLSPFATMWMALFGWITCSSIAYIYGHDENSHEDFLFVNGREYPRLIVLKDGKYSEIRQTLDACIARVIPGLVTDLRLPTPVSTIEKVVGRLIDTMSLIDAVPAFRTNQWNMIVLLFLDALSVHRLPALSHHMTRRNMLHHKVLSAAKMTNEEYETMKDLLLPLGRLPEISMQSGG